MVRSHFGSHFSLICVHGHFFFFFTLSSTVLSSNLIYPLTARAVGAPQMITRPVPSIFPLFSAVLWDLVHSRPVYSLMLSSHFFLCLPCLLPPFTAPCKMVLARPDEPPVHTMTIPLQLQKPPDSSKIVVLVLRAKVFANNILEHYLQRKFTKTVRI